MEQTAVEWLVNELKESIGLKDLHAIEKSKQMFEQQIIISHINGQSEFDSQSFSDTNKKLAEQYYNETFKTE
jgi:3-mercaptopyruvate sulfurtransferase SseA